MIEGADWLCQKHWGKSLIDDHVEILDPATGTGTFVCELLDYFRGQPEKLRHKYKNELHANEVAILPYYVANLNIEATYAAIAGQYGEFENLCFVDTLDNVGGLGIKSGHQHDLFAALSDENVARVVRQNNRKISVVIGNPPYNANQQNENDNNKNRAYPRIDDLIKRSFVKLSSAQKTKVYDMYARFFRWAFDRVHDDGIVAFVTNRSFIDSRTFDGFRRYVQENFSEVYVIDLKGDARSSGEQRRKEAGNVFEDKIRVGIAISFFVKRKGRKGLKVLYDVVPDYSSGEEKLAWLTSAPLHRRQMKQVTPDAKANWINQAENAWDELIPLADKRTKGATVKSQERAVFKLYSLGIVTNRDEWVYSFSRTDLQAKADYLIEHYNSMLQEKGDLGVEIKWTRHLKALRKKTTRLEFDPKLIVNSSYRPFVKKAVYFSDQLNEFQYQTPLIWPDGQPGNIGIVAVVEPRAGFSALAVNSVANKDFFMPSAGQIFARYRYTSTGERVDNITDWALNRFRERYGKGVTKDGIFAYVYATLHDPVWRETYAINLKREFPRLPFHKDFGLWSVWGRRLLDLHIGYETVEPWALTRTDTPDAGARAAGQAPKTILKSDPAKGTIVLDSETTLSGIPAEAWAYRLGNRSALDWVLDQHKERTPRDPTIRANFDTYRFADHKEKVVDLLARVTRVAVETVGIVEAMRAQPRD